MKKYKKSDYSMNKYSDGIVYSFCNGSALEVTLEDYLTENPDKTEQDFKELKKLSDEIYLEQDRDEYNQTRKNITMCNMENLIDSTELPLNEAYIDMLDRQAAVSAFNRLLESGSLTEVQERRFRLYIINGLSMRKIAETEGVTYHAVALSIKEAKQALKKFFEKI